jgi:hypothetical protein
MCMDIHVSLHAIKTDDENDGKRYCAIFTSGTPRRVIHVEEAESDAELRKQVHQLLQRDDWTLATMTTAKPIRREEVKERELDDAAQDAQREFMKVVEDAAASAIAKLPGSATKEQRAAVLHLAIQTLPADLFAEAQRRAGLSDSQARAELLRLAMRLKARSDE